jgi:heme exporter protein A
VKDAEAMTMLAPQPLEHVTSVAGSVVRLVGVGKSIDDRKVLRHINLEVAAGEFVGILGANGAGKSTLLKVIATLTPATTGRIELFGQPLTRDAVALRSRIGLIGHQSMLYRDLTARENLEFFARLYGLRNATNRVAQALTMIGLSSRSDDAVKTFSRGMTQRVAIARALLHDPELLLADEPFAGLDAPSIQSLEQLLADLGTAGKTVIMVNHDIEQTLRIADRAVLLRHGKVVLDQPTHRLYAQEVLSEVSR